MSIQSEILAAATPHDAVPACMPAASARRAGARASALRDARGCPVSTSSREALAHGEEAMWRLVSYFGDPLAAAAAAAEADPQWVMPRVMQADALLTTSDPQFAGEIAAALDAAEALGRGGHANDRERAHIAAARAAAGGDWRHARDLWERILVDHPQDMLALFCAHIFDFLCGDSRNLRQRLARVLPAWSTSAPLYSYAVGMHAFGLEECNLYAEAEATGMAALAINPADPFAVHAVTHVYEMRGEYERGAAWLVQRQADWAPDNGFAFHNWWHLALFRLESLDTDAALALYDAHLESAIDIAMQRVDPTALLWRLHLLGADVGPRWQMLSERWAADGEARGYYAFNDFHAALAHAGAGRVDRVRAVLEAVEAAPGAGVTSRAMNERVGLPLLRGVLAMSEERFGEAAALLLRVRDHAHEFGGSHAQRDIIDQSLLEAAHRARDHALARHLVNERRLAKPSSPLTAHWLARVGASR